jgi:hypothetical protein
MMTILGKVRFLTGSAALAISLAALQSGCGKESISIQKAPKEASAPAGNPAMPSMDPHAAMAAQPPIRWKLPAGWEEQPPDQLRLGNFLLKGPNGAQAQTTIIPLTGLAGTDLDNVNRWRGQVGLPPITEAEMNSQAEKAMIGATESPLFDLSGTPPGKQAKSRILVTLLRQSGVSWFFKMTGDDELVQANKGAFRDFLKTIEFVQPAADPHAGMQLQTLTAPMTAPTTEPAASAKFNWEVPAPWKSLPPGPMQKAKFRATDKEGEKIEATVSSLGGEGGGLLGNVNRWRGQIGLGPIDAGELAKLTVATNWNGSAFTVVDLENSQNKTALCAVISSQKEETWFFKLTGEASLVAREKDAFLKFIQSWKP